MTVPESHAAVSLAVTNNARDESRFAVSDGDGTVVAGRLPGSGGCVHPTVYFIGLPGPPRVLTVEIGDDILEADVSAETESPRWIVVQHYDDLHAELSVWDDRPSFG